jgi:GT2 family glycosyltransferase
MSVVIPVFNGTQYLDACLNSLRQQTLAPREIVAVDDASTDDSAQIIADRHPDVQLIRNPINLGYAGAVNTGIRACGDAKVTCLLNQDTVLDPGCLEAIVNALESDRRIGIVGCKILYPDRRTIQHAGGYVEKPSGVSRHDGYRAVDDGSWDQERSVEFVTGAALAISQEALCKLRGLDATLSHAYYEDIDLCFRASAAGFDVRYVPTATLIHQEGSSILSGSYAQDLHYHTGRVRFVLKHWPPETLSEFLSGELADCLRIESLDDLLARSRAYLRAVSTLPNTRARRARVYASRPEFDAGDAFWLAVARQLLSARDAAIQRSVALPQADARLKPEHLETGAPFSKAVLDQTLKLENRATLREFAFSSDVPVVGRLISAMRSTVHSVAGRWALRYVMDQQSEFNHQLVHALVQLDICMSELSQQIGELAAQIAAQMSAHVNKPPGRIDSDGEE